jgi:hypothetical protein
VAGFFIDTLTATPLHVYYFYLFVGAFAKLQKATPF